jgi:hypothetical protein
VQLSHSHPPVIDILMKAFPALSSIAASAIH